MLYFDNAATSFPKPRCVLDFAEQFYREHGGNAGRGQSQISAEAGKMIKDTRETLKDLFFAPAGYETIFTPSATIALNVILQGLPYKEHQNVYVTHFEHNAVIRTLHAMQNRTPFHIKMIPTQPSLSYDLDEIEAQFHLAPPNAVICSHASNVCGLIAPVSEIFALAKQYEAITVLDASQTAGVLDINLSQIPADFLVFNGHKSLYAPFGVAGFLSGGTYPLPPLIYGGTGLRSGDVEMPEEIPQRYEAGSLNVHAIAGLNESLKWLKTIGIPAIRAKETQLTKCLEYSLIEIGKYNIFCQKEGMGIFSFTLPGYTPDEIGKILGQHDICVRTGLHCAPGAHQFLGTYPAGTVRVSVGYFNTEDEVFQLAEILKMISG